MTYKETLEFLYRQLPAYQRIGKAAYKADLDTTLALDDYFGNPHKAFKTIHIAGTNGKGSVAHILASVLAEAGYKTGLYTSPHLRDFRERIKINGVMIPEDKVVDFVAEHWGAMEKHEPSFFEMTVAMAFAHFANEKTDVAVVEVGMGGRLDSTNIVTPLLSVITNIGTDHLEFLGPTLSDVAREKGGIIKQGIPVVIGETAPFSEQVFRTIAGDRKSPLYFADTLWECNLGEIDNLTGIRDFSVSEKKSEGPAIEGTIPLGGSYQTKNIQTVMESVRQIRKTLSVDDAHLFSGIRNVVRNTGLLGRWQILGTNPLTICDTGHNKEGLEHVMSQLKAIEHEKLRIVLGVVNDKDLSTVLPLFPVDAEYYFTRAALPRALDENLLMARAKEYGLRGHSFATVADALHRATADAADRDLVFIGGSTFVVAEIV